MTDKWLIISYFANADGVACSHHIDDRLPFLQQKGISPLLLSSVCGPRHKNVVHARIPSLVASGIRFEIRHFLKRRVRNRYWFKFIETFLLLPVYPFYFLEKVFLPLDSTWSWWLSASCAAIILSLRHRPKLIYSTGGPVCAHLAAAVVSTILKVTFIAEFQDPLDHPQAAETRFEGSFLRRVHGIVLRRASAVIFLTHQAAAAVAASTHQPHKAEVCAIYAGADPPEVTHVHAKGSVFTIAHFGSLAGTRNLQGVLAGLEMLMDDNPVWQSCVRLRFYGSNDRNVLAQIGAFKFNDVLQVKGKVSRKEALAAMQTADLLLLVQNSDDISRVTIPSKVYEYLHSLRPVLALLYRNEELKTMLAQLGHRAVEVDAPAAIRDGLKAYLDDWQRDVPPCSFPASPYTVESAVEQVIALTKKVSLSTM